MEETSSVLKLTVRIDPETNRVLSEIAAEDRRSVSKHIAHLIDREIKQRRPGAGRPRAKTPIETETAQEEG